MFKAIPSAFWLVLVALNVFMFFLNMALERPSYMAFNLVSGAACYFAYMLYEKMISGEDQDE